MVQQIKQEYEVEIKLILSDGREVELGGDIILAIDGNPVRKIDDILSYLEREKSVGDKYYINHY